MASDLKLITLKVHPDDLAKIDAAAAAAVMSRTAFMLQRVLGHPGKGSRPAPVGAFTRTEVTPRFKAGKK